MIVRQAQVDLLEIVYLRSADLKKFLWHGAEDRKLGAEERRDWRETLIMSRPTRVEPPIRNRPAGAAPPRSRLSSPAVRTALQRHRPGSAGCSPAARSMIAEIRIRPPVSSLRPAIHIACVDKCLLLWNAFGTNCGLPASNV